MKHNVLKLQCENWNKSFTNLIKEQNQFKNTLLNLTIIEALFARHLVDTEERKIDKYRRGLRTQIC